MAAPTSLTYAPTTMVFNENSGGPILPRIPTVVGTPATSFELDPTTPVLPQGLSLDPISGIISGTPTLAQPWGSYIIRAVNTDGFTPCTISIRVYSALVTDSYIMQPDEVFIWDMSGITHVLSSIGYGDGIATPHIFNSLALKGGVAGEAFYIKVISGNLHVSAYRIIGGSQDSRLINGLSDIVFSAGDHIILICDEHGTGDWVAGPAILSQGITQVGQGLSFSQGTLSLDPATATQLGGVIVGAGFNLDPTGLISNTNPTPYALPQATPVVLGGVKIGIGLQIDSQGVLSAPLSTYTLPPATNTTLGGIKVGSGLLMDPVSRTLSTTASGVIVGSGLSQDVSGILYSALEVSACIPTTDGVRPVYRYIVQTPMAYTYPYWWKLRPAAQDQPIIFSMFQITDANPAGTFLFEFEPTQTTMTSTGPNTPYITLNVGDMLELRQVQSGVTALLALSGTLLRHP